MNESLTEITCPECQHIIHLDKALTNQIEIKINKKIKDEQKTAEAALKKRENEIEKKTEILKKEKESIEQEISERLKSEKNRVEKELKNQISKEKESEIQELKNTLQEKQLKLNESRQNELELRKERVKLNDEKQEFELEKQRQLDKEREKIKQDAQKQAQEEMQFKIAEKDKQIKDALKSNEDLKRKLHQGSQQTQGEVLELALEELLNNQFPYDEISPVQKGIKGVDVIQKVNNKRGQCCGTIAWETKRAKTWSDLWIEKLKNDQRKISADIAIIVSEVLPSDIKSFAFKDGVFIVNYHSAHSLTEILRNQLIAISSVKNVNIGKNEKLEILYNYLSGTEFKHKVEAIIEAFTSMQNDLEKEKRSMNKIWAKREKQISQVITSTATMHGDIQGLLGSSVQAIPALELDPCSSIE